MKPQHAVLAECGADAKPGYYFKVYANSPGNQKVDNVIGKILDIVLLNSPMHQAITSHRLQGEETIVPVPTFRSTLPVGGDRPMHRTVQEDNI